MRNPTVETVGLHDFVVMARYMAHPAAARLPAPSPFRPDLIKAAGIAARQIGPGLLPVGRSSSGRRPDRINCCAWSPDGNRLALAVNDGNVHIQQVNPRAPEPFAAQHTLAHGASVTWLAWSPDGGNVLATACADKIIRLWDTTSGAVAQEYALDHEPSRVSWATNGTRFAVTYVAWNAPTFWFSRPDATPRLLPGGVRFRSERVRQIAWHPTALGVFAAGYFGQGGSDGPGGEFRLVDLDDLRSDPPVVPGGSQVRGPVAWSHAGDRLALPSSQGQVAVVDYTGRFYSLFPSERTFSDTTGIVGYRANRPMRSVAWSADDRYLASVSEAQAVLIWDVQTGRLEGVLPKEILIRADGLRDRLRNAWAAWVPQVAWHPSGLHLAVTTSDNDVDLWSFNRTA